MATKVQCPAPEDCGFEEEPQSVHAHITSSNEHKGESGVSWEREIANELPNGEQAPWERSGTEAVEEQRETGEEVTEEVLDDQREQALEDGVESDEEPSESEETGEEEPEESDPEESEGDAAAAGVMAAGAALPAVAGGEKGENFWLYVALSIVIVVGVLWYVGRDGDEPVQEESDGEETEPVGGAGLIGA